MNEETQQQIEAYLLGQLDDAGARQVETRADSDPAFARELQLQRDILKGIELFGDEQMRKKIAAADHALNAEGFFDAPPPGAAVTFPLYRWAAVAVLLLALGVGLWYWLNQPAQQPAAPAPAEPVATIPALPDTTDKTPQTAPATPPRQPAPPDSRYAALARAHWSSPDYSNLRAARKQAPTLRGRTADAFQAGDYQTVIRLLENLTPAEPNYWELSEMYAHACFLSGQTGRAAARFQQIAAAGQLPFSEQAEWYLLLCRLAALPEGRTEFDALRQKILSDEGHPYWEQARGLGGGL